MIKANSSCRTERCCRNRKAGWSQHQDPDPKEAIEETEATDPEATEATEDPEMEIMVVHQEDFKKL